MPGWTPPDSTATRKYPVQGWMSPTGVLGWAASPRGCWGTQLWVLGVGCGHPAPSLSPQGLQDCLADLLQPFQGDAIDVVAGIDAMGFILGEQDMGHR